MKIKLKPIILVAALALSACEKEPMVDPAVLKRPSISDEVRFPKEVVKVQSNN